jgi:hypothetical protein
MSKSKKHTASAQNSSFADAFKEYKMHAIERSAWLASELKPKKILATFANIFDTQTVRPPTIRILYGIFDGEDRIPLAHSAATKRGPKIQHDFNLERFLQVLQHLDPFIHEEKTSEKIEHIKQAAYSDHGLNRFAVVGQAFIASVGDATIPVRGDHRLDKFPTFDALWRDEITLYGTEQIGLAVVRFVKHLSGLNLPINLVVSSLTFHGWIGSNERDLWRDALKSFLNSSDHRVTIHLRLDDSEERLARLAGTLSELFGCGGNIKLLAFDGVGTDIKNDVAARFRSEYIFAKGHGGILGLTASSAAPGITDAIVLRPGKETPLEHLSERFELQDSPINLLTQQSIVGAETKDAGAETTFFQHQLEFERAAAGIFLYISYVPDKVRPLAWHPQFHREQDPTWSNDQQGKWSHRVAYRRFGGNRDKPLPEAVRLLEVQHQRKMLFEESSQESQPVISKRYIDILPKEVLQILSPKPVSDSGYIGGEASLQEKLEIAQEWLKISSYPNYTIIIVQDQKSRHSFTVSTNEFGQGSERVLVQSQQSFANENERPKHCNYELAHPRIAQGFRGFCRQLLQQHEKSKSAKHNEEFQNHLCEIIKNLETAIKQQTKPTSKADQRAVNSAA